MRVLLVIFIILFFIYFSGSDEKGITKKGYALNGKAAMLSQTIHLDEAELTFKEALQVFDKAIEKDNQYGDAYYWKGSSYLWLYSLSHNEFYFEKAQECFDVALDINPRDEFVLNAKWNLYAIKWNDLTATLYFKDALKINPNNKETIRWLLMIEWSLWDWERVLFQKLMEDV